MKRLRAIVKESGVVVKSRREEAMITADQVKKELLKYAVQEKADFLPKFFSSVPGGYGEGDQFIGVTVPNQRKVARKYWKAIYLDELKKLLQDPVHECRLTAIFIMVLKFEKATDDSEKEAVVQLYLSNLSYVNNWDLVDSSAYKILAPYLEHGDRHLLYELADSPDIWENRIAIIATLHFIRNHDFDDTLKIAERLLDHPHDLIHKAVGWMLREVGNRNREKELQFLNRYYSRMPRTMLRYAIEKFEPELREKYMRK
jgi:3-methyladenine DNA glycosylase AlkD